MNKTAGFIFVFFLVASSAFAAPAITPGLSSPAADQAKVGVVAAVRGSVRIETSTKVGREVKSGAPIFLGDIVSTNEKGNLQIMLMDQTVFTIGPNSAIVIDKFIYDPTSQTGQVNAKIVKGVFRFVTGKIGQKNPESVKVDLPAGTIGIRGTIVAGQAQGQRSFVVLLGPGERNNTSSRQGKIIVGNTVNGQLKAVVINRSGFGTVIEANGGAPSQPFKVPAEMMQTITSALGSTSDQGSGDAQDSQADQDGNAKGDEDSATEQAGQDTAEAQDAVLDTTDTTDIFNNVDDESSEVSQQSVVDQNAILDGISTFNNLIKVPGGAFKYEQNAVPLYNTVNTTSQTGTYNILFNIDFGARTVGGPSSTINGTTNGHNFSFAIYSQSFGSGSDYAVYKFNNSNTNPGNANIVLNATVALLNQGGVPGASMLHSVEIQDNTSLSLPTGEGAGITPRQST